VTAAIVLTGGPGGPTVADAARFAARPPTEPAPPPSGTNGTTLALQVGGVAFPNLEPSLGWRAVGRRRGRLHGRDVAVVYYAKGAGRAAYAIVGGPALSRPRRGWTTVDGGVRYQTLLLDGRPAITWRRGGRTCVIVRTAGHAPLLSLAGWQA
jgi:hypothetical protein